MKLFETILTAYLNTTNQKKVMVRLMRNILNIKKVMEMYQSNYTLKHIWVL